MFSSFFYLLRGRGLDVSLNEWLTLIDALDKGLARSSFSNFYYLCRAVLVKSESEFDIFDGAFLEFFKELKLNQELPKELIDWLENPKEDKNNYDETQAKKNLSLSQEEIMKMLEERLKEQDSEHNGGSYWVGTGGMSVFGTNGNSPNGIRIGGISRNKTAFEVAGERGYKDFRNDKVLDIRQFQTAFRRLRQFSSRVDVPKTELDIDETIQKTSDSAGRLNLVYDRPRQNTVKLLLLMDSGGSMDYYNNMCSALFQAVSKSNHFKDLKVYYFHNCIYSKLYTDPQCQYGKWVDTDWVLDNIDNQYKVIIVGDAAMDPYELFGGSYFSFGSRDRSAGIEWLKKFRDKYEKIIWLNPVEKSSHTNDYWQQTRNHLESEFDMYTLTVKNLERALKKLIVSK